jgi:hypothetical protein
MDGKGNRGPASQWNSFRFVVAICHQQKDKSKEVKDQVKVGHRRQRGTSQEMLKTVSNVKQSRVPEKRMEDII